MVYFQCIRDPQRPTNGAQGVAGPIVIPGRDGDVSGQQFQFTLGATTQTAQGGLGERHLQTRI